MKPVVASSLKKKKKYTSATLKYNNTDVGLIVLI